MSDLIFAIFHLCLLIGIIVYAFILLAQGNIFRFGLIMVCLAGYYFLILHKPVKREIERRKKAKS
ncbi:hypothetical protein ACFLT2_14110 [Acidobacteriota bacterium]